MTLVPRSPCFGSFMYGSACLYGARAQLLWKNVQSAVACAIPLHHCSALSFPVCLPSFSASLWLGPRPTHGSYAHRLLHGTSHLPH